jgi:serine/threonine protein kinase
MAIKPAQNVIQLFGICTDAPDGKLRIVMELCTHGSLRAYVKALRGSQWTVDVAVDVFLQLASGMRHLHACGVLHRDLKTDNALISSKDPLVVKWADFGCSVKLDSDTTYGGADHVYTELKAPIAWLAPETFTAHAGGKVASAASDVFMLGCCYLELLTSCTRAPYDWLSGFALTTFRAHESTRSLGPIQVPLVCCGAVMRLIV